MLGLSRNDTTITHRMITTGDTIVGYEITSMHGVIEAFAEKSFAASSVAVGGIGLGVVGGGELESLLWDAKDRLARSAFEVGANAVIAFRYGFIGRSSEKSVIAYGTAVSCKKTPSGEEVR